MRATTATACERPSTYPAGIVEEMTGDLFPEALKIVVSGDGDDIT